MNANNEKRFHLFSNGTEFMDWHDRNCCKCIKAVWYNEKKDFNPKYRCKIQEHIEMACIGDGCGNQRDYQATQSLDCPHKVTEKKKPATKDNSLRLFDL